MLACNYETVRPTAKKMLSDVDERLVEYFKSFVEEGASRGVEVIWALTPVSGVIEDIDESRILGQCQFNSLHNNRVTIDANFWSGASALYKEFVVFHELGHCVLLRDHNENQDSNGICMSIMRSGKGSCYDAYNTKTRSYYLDELFSVDLR